MDLLLSVHSAALRRHENMHHYHPTGYLNLVRRLLISSHLRCLRIRDFRRWLLLCRFWGNPYATCRAEEVCRPQPSNLRWVHRVHLGPGDFFCRMYSLTGTIAASLQASLMSLPDMPVVTRTRYSRSNLSLSILVSLRMRPNIRNR